MSTGLDQRFSQRQSKALGSSGHYEYFAIKLLRISQPTYQSQVHPRRPTANSRNRHGAFPDVPSFEYARCCENHNDFLLPDEVFQVE